MKYRIKNTKTTLLILGIYQIFGGLAGLFVTAYLALKTGTINGAIFLIFSIAIGLYLFSIKSGTVLIRKDYKRGLIYSMINQAIQIFSIGIGSYIFDYSSGAKGMIGLNFTNGFKFKLDAGLTSEFNMAINTDNLEYFIYVNLLAIFLLVVLNDIYKEKFCNKLNEKENILNEGAENTTA